MQGRNDKAATASYPRWMDDGRENEFRFFSLLMNERKRTRTQRKAWNVKETSRQRKGRKEQGREI